MPDLALTDLTRQSHCDGEMGTDALQLCVAYPSSVQSRQSVLLVNVFSNLVYGGRCEAWIGLDVRLDGVCRVESRPIPEATARGI